MCGWGCPDGNNFTSGTHKDTNANPRNWKIRYKELSRLARDLHSYLQTLGLQGLPNCSRYKAIDKRHQKRVRIWSRHHVGACQEQSYNKRVNFENKSSTPQLDQGHSIFRRFFLHLRASCWREHQFPQFRWQYWIRFKGRTSGNIKGDLCWRMCRR